jgi:hypothetical protein
MQDCTKAIPKARIDHKTGIDKGKFLAELYLKGKTKYEEAKRVALDIQDKCGDRIARADQEIAKLDEEIKSLDNVEAVNDPLGERNQLSKYKDLKASAQSEKKFYRTIIKNAKIVIGMADKGLLDERALREKAKPLKDVSPLQVELDELIADAAIVYEEAMKLWKQWQDASKDYDCGVPPNVEHAESICKDGNTKYSPKCQVTCAPGYSGNGTFNKLRCEKIGKFGKELAGEWTGIAACVGELCGLPQELENAKAVIAPIRYPESAHYHCHEGFWTPEGNHSLTIPCGKEGNFLPDQSHVCKPIKCGAAPKVPNTNPVDGEFSYTETAVYTCVEGHTLDGMPGSTAHFKLSCQSTGKFDQPKACPPVRCGPPPAFFNTKLTFKSNTDTYHQHFQDTVKYQCTPGYTLTAAPKGSTEFTLECTADGEFSVHGTAGDLPLPTCQPICIGIPDPIPHGSFARHEMCFGDTEVVTANVGYSTAGKYNEGHSFVISVSPEGTLEGVKKLLPVACGEPPIAKKAKAKFPKEVAVYQELVRYECEKGYSIDKTASPASGAFSILCQADGQFSALPPHGGCANIDDCDGHTCGPHGSCVDHLMNYTCDCQPGYSPRKDPNTLELNCGNIDDCGPEACGVGKCIDKVQDYECECPKGHEQVIEPNGDKPVKTCRAVTCGGPPPGDNMQISPPEAADQKVFYGHDPIVYQCIHGHTIDGEVMGKGFFSIECQANKKFTKSEKCKPIACDKVPKVENAVAKKDSAKYAEVVSFKCDKGHTLDSTLDGETSFGVTCQASGLFTDPPACLPVSCGEPNDVAHAFHTSLHFMGVSYKEKAKYKCLPGFSLDAKKDGETTFEVECQANGKFTETKVCKAKVCGALPKDNVKFGAPKDEGDIHFPQSTEIICKDGYTVDGRSDGNKSYSVSCLETGEFSKYDPEKCEPVDCGVPHDMQHAKILSNKEKKTFGQQVEYECLVGFTTGGEHEAPTKYHVECLASGGFSKPTDDMLCRNVNDCEGHTCGKRGTCVDLIGPAPAYTCNCSAGFEIHTEDNGEKVCGNIDDCAGTDCGVGVCKDMIGGYSCSCPSGYFVAVDKNKDKTCAPLQCSVEVPIVKFGKLVTKKVKAPIVFPQTLTYECEKGHSVDGTTADARKLFQAQCKADGQLHGMAQCQRISCGTAHVLAHTKILEPHDLTKSIDYEDVIKYECDEGYGLHGKHGDNTFEVECEADGHLTHPKVCEPVTCGKAPEEPNSKAQVSEEVIFGEVAQYQCNWGYTLDATPQGKNEFEVDCLKTGKFSDASDSCKPVTVKAPSVGKAVMSKYAGKAVDKDKLPQVISYPNTVTFACDDGFSTNGLSSGPKVVTARVDNRGHIIPTLPKECQEYTFVIHGQVKDATNGQSLGKAKVHIEHDELVTADAISGHFFIDGVRPGKVRAIYEREGYIRTEKTFDVTADIQSGGVADISMSPEMAKDQWRVVLKWGEEPRDLDAYAKFALGKAYWAGKHHTWRDLEARLEHDDVTSFGPETIHLTGVGSCTSGDYYCKIRYSVNDYTETGQMHEKPAEVTLYNGDKVAGNWKIDECKSSVSEDNLWWEVFDLDGATNKITWTCHDGIPPLRPTLGYGELDLMLRGAGNSSSGNSSNLGGKPPKSKTKFMGN